MPLFPVVLWAQTKEWLYLTIELEDPENVKIDLKENELYFSGSKGKNEYEFTLNFLKPINVEESKYSTKRNIKFKIVKKEKERWKTLNNDGKKHWIKCDWNLWVDTDEEDKDIQFDDMGMNNFGGLGGMPDMSQFANMGGLGGMGGMDGMEGMDFSKLGAGLGNMGNLSGMGGMDQFKNMPNMNDYNDDDDDDDDDDSSSYSDDSSDEDDDDEDGEDEKQKDKEKGADSETEKEKSSKTNDKKESVNLSSGVDGESDTKIQDPIMEVQEPVA